MKKKVAETLFLYTCMLKYKRCLSKINTIFYKYKSKVSYLNKLPYYYSGQ